MFMDFRKVWEGWEIEGLAKKLGVKVNKKADYIAKVSESLLELKRQRFLLDEDVTYLLQQAYDKNYWDQK